MAELITVEALRPTVINHFLLYPGERRAVVRALAEQLRAAGHVRFIGPPEPAEPAQPAEPPVEPAQPEQPAQPTEPPVERPRPPRRAKAA